MSQRLALTAVSALGGGATQAHAKKEGSANSLPPVGIPPGFSTGPHPAYYEVLQPADGRSKATIIMLHGGAHSGACYLSTVDGRPGWAYNFVERGFRVLVPDWPGIGRSGYVDPDQHGGQINCDSISDLIEQQNGPLVLMTHSMSGAYGWPLMERHADRISALVGVAPAPPGNIQDTSKLISRVGDIVTIEQSDSNSYPATMHLDMSKNLLPGPQLRRKLIGPSTQFPPELINHYLETLLATPPRLIYERMNVEGSQIKVTDASRLTGKPIAVVCGDKDLDHTPEFEAQTIAWLRGEGALAEMIFLPDRGVSGNGHMMMLERNSRDIAIIIADWIETSLTLTKV